MDFSKLDNLTNEEKKEVLKILAQISKDGVSDSYNQLLNEDYEEVPVDIETFLKDERYLGKGLTNEEGRFTVYPYWVETLKKLYPDPLKPATCNTLALTGAIGLGKSFMAVLVGLYDLYKTLCLKDPYIFYGLQPIDKLTYAFMNITLDAAKGVAWSKMQQLLTSSPWFMEKGSLTKSVFPEWVPPKGIELIAGSRSEHILGRAVKFAFFDEISFIPNQDVEKQKQKAENLVRTALIRMQSRFMKGTYNPTIMVIASSKRTEQSYMESFIAQKKKNESKTTYIVDEPQWIIRPDKDTKEKFKVAVGNKFLSSEVLPLDLTENDIDVYRQRGYTILDVPMGFYEYFYDDVDKSLMDIAGISTSQSTKYIAGPRLVKVIHDNYENPFTQEIIEVGNSPDDTTQYWDYFKLDNLGTHKELMEKPLFIHLDMSISGDKTGIAGVWIKGKKPPQEGQPPSKELFYTVAFHVAVKAPKGYQVSFEKNRQFIYWLREQGFNIKGVSSDTFQSADLLQQLAGKGYNTEIISVDRVKDNICLPYQYLRSTIYEQRVEIYKNRSKLLYDELIGLERNNNNGKIDHTAAGINSKDTADAVCGAIWNASQYGEQFDFDYGDTLDTIFDVSMGVSEEKSKEELIIDFEEELKKMPDINKTGYIDYGLGASKTDSDFYAIQGIII